MPIPFRNPSLAPFLGTTFIAALLAGLVLLPGPAINTTADTAQIRFSADRRFVINPGDCTTLRWEVSGIQAVYLNGEGVVGTGEREVCITPTTLLNLHVVFRDGSHRDYSLEVGILARAWFTWVLLPAAGVMLVAGSYLTLRRRFVRQAQWLAVSLKKVVTGTALLGMGVLAVGVLLELGLRFYFTHFGTEEELQLYVYSAEEMRSRIRDIIPVPYVGWVFAPGGDRNNLGYRSREIQIPKPKGVFRIVAVGNSITWGLGLSRNEAYPTQLERILHDDYRYTNVEVINAGNSGATTWQAVPDLAFRILEVEPDLIIVYHANLDVGATFVDPDCYRGMNPHRGISPGTGVWQKYPKPVSPSALYRLIAINAGWIEKPTVSTLPIEPVIECAQHRTLSNEEAAQVNPPVYFERNLRTIVGIAAAHGVQVLLSTFAYFPDASQEFTPLWLQEAIERHNEAIRRVAQDTGVLFYDLRKNLPYNPAFWQSDGYHFAPMGAREAARQYADYLVRQAVIPSVSTRSE